MPNKRAIVWFRQDLRLHDNEALTIALKNAQEVIPVFVFDERLFKGKTNWGFPKTGKHRAKFIIESVTVLKQSLQQRGSDLIVRIGNPEDEIFHLARKLRTYRVVCNMERLRHEVQVQDTLEQRLWSIGQELWFFRGKMLFNAADLPFPVTHIPDSFPNFRKEVERFVSVREPLAAPKMPMPTLPEEIEVGEIPTLKDFGFEDFKPDKRGKITFKGGEKEAKKQMYHFFDQLSSISLVNDKESSSNGEKKSLVLCETTSSFLSPYLSQGCISPKLVYYSLKQFAEGKNNIKKNVDTFLQNLIYRDFLFLMAKKYTNRIFHKGGIQQRLEDVSREDLDLLNSWIESRTGVPIVDAIMREFKNTGFVSKHGRNIAASFLLNDLKLNWQMGADYCESAAIDYEPSSNYGNWNNIAGIGSDPKEKLHLDVEAQARRCDPDGVYAELWG